MSTRSHGNVATSRSPQVDPFRRPQGGSSHPPVDTVDVKTWVAELPSAAAVRPARCPACKAASRPPGCGLRLWGHGPRDRILWGPGSASSPPTQLVIRARRYLCRACAVTITVVPRGVAPTYLYTGCAIALALAPWGISREPADTGRHKVDRGPGPSGAVALPRSLGARHRRRPALPRHRPRHRRGSPAGPRRAVRRGRHRPRLSGRSLRQLAPRTPAAPSASPASASASPSSTRGPISRRDAARSSDSSGPCAPSASTTSATATRCTP